jgi:acetoin utilization protein AcuB
LLVRDVLSSPVLTIGADTPLAEAYRTMQEHGVRHLPVVDDGRLVGVVSDRDLRLATSVLAPVPFAPDAAVSAVMAREPVTAGPSDPVEDAARAMRDRKIGCLPVLDGGRLVGILTGRDLLHALVRMTGVDRPSGRLEVRLPDRPGELARLTNAVSGRGVNIHSVLTSPDARTAPDHGAGAVRTVLRIGSIEVRPLARHLREIGIDVVWPPEKPA